MFYPVTEVKKIDQKDVIVYVNDLNYPDPKSKVSVARKMLSCHVVVSLKGQKTANEHPNAGR